MGTLSSAGVGHRGWSSFDANRAHHRATVPLGSGNVEKGRKNHSMPLENCPLGIAKLTYWFTVRADVTFIRKKAAR